MNTSFDVIVIGVGSMGSAACYQLASRGLKVLGLEQFDIVHEFGAHAGQSRIIRKAYFENPDYVPLLQRAYENWALLEKEIGQQLYFQTGLLYFGPPDHLLLKGVKQSASLYNIPLENLDHSSASRRFPQFSIPKGFDVLFEPDAGFVTPEHAIRIFAEQAVIKGAIIHTNEKVIQWKQEGKKIVVTTSQDNYRCNKLVITAGPWAAKLIPGLGDKLRITRQFVSWIKPGRWDDFTLGNFPCWLMADATSHGCYYGFPILDEQKFGPPQGLKLAHHYAAMTTDPDDVNRQMTRDDERDVNYVLDKYLPGCFESMLSYKICLYANSPDEDFIIDKLPGYEDYVTVACGFSGHGFKFASVVGEILADLALQGRTKLPIGFLNAQRF